MKEPHIKRDYRSTFHRDGTVSYWNIYRTRWERFEAGMIPAVVMATLSGYERHRILLRIKTP